jgi:Undecaprenyl-phosphate galactose phosphotransferase WbaP
LTTARDNASPAEQRLTSMPLVLLPGEHRYLRVANLGRWKPAWKSRLVPAVLVLADFVLALLVCGSASLLQRIWGTGPLSEVTAVAIVPVIAAWLGLRALFELYPGYGLDSAEQLRRHTYATLATLAILAVFALSFQVGQLISRLLVALVFLGLLVLAPFVQHLMKWAMNEVGAWGKPMVVLSYKQAGEHVVDLLKEQWTLGYDPVAVFDYRLDPVETSSEDASAQQAISEVVNLAREHCADTAILAMPHTRREHLVKLVKTVSLSFRRVLVVPNLIGLTNSAVVARDLAGIFAVEIKYNLLNPWALRAKRGVDLVATVIGGALLIPLLLILALLVCLESGTPVFYKDWRMGKDGKLFPCIKFRTMVSDAEALLQRMLQEDAISREEYSKYHKLRNDPRVTRVGRFLRRTSLDELPQLWNVLRGEMSLVGPRPYLPRESQEIGVAQNEILRVSPGITGPWQVAGRNDTLFSERVETDVCYVRDWSIWLDIVLLARTLKSLLFSRAAY